MNDSNQNFILLKDIDLSAVANWTPITGFSGYLHGNNKTIKNLTINSSSSNVGFFSTLNGRVANLTFENANITVSGHNENIGILSGKLSTNTVLTKITISGKILANDSKNVGGFAGRYDVEYNGTFISSVTSSVAVSGCDYVGGIIGSLNGSTWVNYYTLTLSEWNNRGNITASGDYVGGLVGYAFLQDTASSGSYCYKLNVVDCKNTGNITGKTYVGGLIGYGKSDNNSSCISRSSNSSSIVGEAYVGCIAGCLENISIDDCTNTNSSLTATKYVTVDAIKYAYVGGFVGKGYGANKCTNEVAINYTSAGRYVGGVMGYCYINTDTTFANLANAATISGCDYVGGIIGSLNGSTWVNYYTLTLSEWNNRGNITASGDYVGGLVGYAFLQDTASSGSYCYKLNVVDCKNTGNITGKTYVGGLIGYGKSDSSSSVILDSVSSGTVSGSANYDNIAGKLENITIK